MKKLIPLWCFALLMSTSSAFADIELHKLNLLYSFDDYGTTRSYVNGNGEGVSIVYDGPPEGVTLGKGMMFWFDQSTVSASATTLEVTGNLSAAGLWAPFQDRYNYSAKMILDEPFNGVDWADFMLEFNKDAQTFSVTYGGETSILSFKSDGTTDFDVWGYMGGEINYLQISTLPFVKGLELYLNGEEITNWTTHSGAVDMQGWPAADHYMTDFGTLIDFGSSFTLSGRLLLDEVELGAKSTTTTGLQFNFGHAEGVSAPVSPEPTSLLIVGTGLAGLFSLRRRRK